MPVSVRLGVRLSVRRGKNHEGGAAAMRPCRLWHMLGLVMALLLAVPAARAQDDNPLVQRGVPAEATAETAVIAKEQALAAAQREAYDRLATAMNLPRGLSTAQIEGLVQSLVVESERITTRGYSGRLTVNFNPRRVEALAARGSASSGGGGGGSGAAPVPSTGRAVTTVDAVATYRTFPEWVELNRRLTAAGAVSRVEVVTLAGDMARLRLGLRAPPADAAVGLGEAGIVLVSAPTDAQSGEGWRVSLAGGR